MSLRTSLVSALFLAFSLALAGCGGGSHTPPSGNPPSISAQPANQTVTVGAGATFSVTASGTSPLTYQWVKGTNWISGATGASYTTPATSMQDNGAQFHVIVSNAVGSVNSNTVSLTVNAAAIAPSITQQPAGQEVTAGQTATFSVVATGTAPLSYQWQKGTANISGATAASYTTPATTVADNNTQYRVVVTNSAGNATSNAATLTVDSTPVAPTITVQPANRTVTTGQTATFSVTATGTAPLGYQWQKGTTNIAGATSASYTTPATTGADNGSTFKVVVSNSVSSVTSFTATLTVNAASVVEVLTYHNDIARTGANLNEPILTTSNVASATFGKKANFAVDGKVDAQPLYASNVAVPGNGIHNLLIAVTEHDSVYAFDADSGAIVWQKSMLQSGETTSDTHGCSQVSPEIGVTATPVIDRTRGANGAVYLIAMSRNGSTYHQRIHALDLATGAELFSGPKEITATYPGTGQNSSGGNVIFDPGQYKERMGLLLMNGVLYTAWASHCDFGPYTGWVMGHNADTLAQTTVLNITPNGGLGAFWSSGGGITADPQGNIYLLAGNGDFGTTLNSGGFPSNGNYGNGFLKLSTTGGQLAVADYFEMFNQQSENNQDVDLGSGGAMVLPDFVDGGGQTRHLVVGAGKDTNIYLLDRGNMGKFNSSGNNIYQQVSGVLGGGIWSVPAYFNNRVYYGPVGNHLMSFTVSNARLSSAPNAQSNNSFSYPGTSPSVSANGSSNGIVWAVDNGGATLHAYDATTMNELYNSDQAAGNRDHFGSGNKFITPTIVNGEVFVGTQNSVAVFGPLP